ncbi:hypothetical protein FALCPG4_007464 [Fusarium falciforme]
MPLVAVHTRFWNATQTIPHGSHHVTSSKPDVRLKNCSFTAKSALNGWCVLHSDDCGRSCSQSTAQRAAPLPHAHASLNKIRNTRKRRNTTPEPTRAQAGSGYALSSLDWTHSESKDGGSPYACSHTDSTGSNQEVLENFGTTDNEREDLLDYFQTKIIGGTDDDEGLRPTKRVRNEELAKDGNQKFEEWIYKTFDQLFCIAHLPGE